MRLYNSLTRTIEEFIPLNPPTVNIYACGPTVYDYPTIGNWRTYTTTDLLIRALKAAGHEVKFVMNITDVGHLTGDNLGDADIGEDRLEKAAKKERKTAWDIAEFYTKHFLEGYDELNLSHPLKFTKATEYIPEQIDLVKKIEEKSFAYKISDGVYFDVAAYEKAGNTYGELSTLDKINEGARVEVNPEKRDPRDFALWKLSTRQSASPEQAKRVEGSIQKRDMEWESPWGKGFPGWHIECSAMSMKYLGEQLDIHVGGEDLKSIHHPNEIAQSEAATGKKPFSRIWVHGAFLQVDGGRMGKSLGNAYTLFDIQEKGFEPLDLRYFYLTAHYRKVLNFTWEGLAAAREARSKLKAQSAKLKAITQNTKRTVLSTEKLDKANQFRLKFQDALADDLNTPQAIAIVWETMKSNIPSEDKYDLLVSFDEVLGLQLRTANSEQRTTKVPDDIQKLIDRRNQLRKEKKWEEADVIREELQKKGYEAKDTENGTIVRKKG